MTKEVKNVIAELKTLRLQTIEQYDKDDEKRRMIAQIARTDLEEVCRQFKNSCKAEKPKTQNGELSTTIMHCQYDTYVNQYAFGLVVLLGEACN